METIELATQVVNNQNFLVDQAFRLVSYLFASSVLLCFFAALSIIIPVYIFNLKKVVFLASIIVAIFFAISFFLFSFWFGLIYFAILFVISALVIDKVNLHTFML